MPRTTTDPLILAAEEADAEAAAAEAEAVAARASVTAARARARAARLRRAAAGPGSIPDPEAGTSDAEPVETAPDPGAHAEPAPEGTVRGRFAKRLPRVPVRALPRPSGRVLGRIAAALVIVVSLGAGGFSVWNHYRLTAEQARTDEYLEAARAGVIALTSLDSARAADDVRRVLDHSTGAFRTDFQSRSEDFTTVVEQSRVATRGEITAAAVESMTEESAVVLVSAVSKVTNSAGAQEEPRVWRLSVTVTRDGSALKMSKVEFVP